MMLKSIFLFPWITYGPIDTNWQSIEHIYNRVGMNYLLLNVLKTEVTAYNERHKIFESLNSLSVTTVSQARNVGFCPRLRSKF